MLLIVISVYDRATQAYGRPVFLPALGAALRSFEDEVNSSEKTDLSQHPDDFELFKLGEFDDARGIFKNEAEPVLLTRGKDCVRSK